MPTVTRRQDGSYCSTLQVGGRRRFVYGRTPSEVRQKLQALQAEVARAGHLPPPGSQTLNGLLDAWLATTTYRPTTRRHVEGLLARHVRPALGGLRLRHLEPAHLESVTAALLRQGKRRTASAVLACLHRALAVAVRWGWLGTNPAARVPRPAYRPARPSAWSVAQVRTFLQATTAHPCGPLWAFLLGSGLRLGEALALRWSDCDLDQGTVTVRRTGTHCRGQWVEGPPKTAHGERAVHLPPEAVAALRRQRARQAAQRLRAGAAWQEGEYVFTGRTGRPLSARTAEVALRPVCERLGLPPLTPHGLRHQHASLCLAGGVPLPDVSRRLGHASVAITAAVYSHALPGRDRQTAETVGRLLAGGREG